MSEAGITTNYQTGVVREHWLAVFKGRPALVITVQLPGTFADIICGLDGKGWGFTQRLLNGLGYQPDEQESWTDILRSLHASGHLAGRGVKVSTKTVEGKVYRNVYPLGNDKTRMSLDDGAAFEFTAPAAQGDADDSYDYA